jgi:hypothetical protein
VSPQRIQRKRIAGWVKPDNAVIVDRTSRWGNPFKATDAITEGFADNDSDARKVCVEFFDAWLDGEPEFANVEPARRTRILAELHTLAGKDLACACKPGELCHGDSLIRRANRRSRAVAA